MNFKRIFILSALLAMPFSISTFDTALAVSPFATEVVYTSGYSSLSLYQDPSAVLGKPHALNPAWGPTPAGPVSMVEPAFANDPITGAYKITTIRDDQVIVVAFDHPIADDPSNPYGIDFVVFGNSMFVYGGYANIPYTKAINNPTSVFAEPVTVSVSPDGVSWYTYKNGPYGDDLFPTQAVKMREDNTFRDDKNRYWEKDFTKPVNPALTVDDFGGITVYDADQKYGVSAGGTGFDLKESGFTEIKYIKFISSGGEIDAVADVDPELEEAYVVPIGTTSVDIDPASLALKWNLPEHYGNVTYHLNLYGNASFPEFSTDITGTNSVETTFKELKGHQGYRLYITADYGKVNGNSAVETGLWQFYTKNREPHVTEISPGNGKKYVPTNAAIGVKAQDPDGDSITSACLLVWEGSVSDDREADFICNRTSTDVELTFPMSGDILQSKPNTLYTWQVILSDDHDGVTSSPRFTMITAPEGYERKAVTVSGTADIFDGLDMVPSEEIAALKKAASFDVNLMTDAATITATSEDTRSMGLFGMLSADAILPEALSFNIDLSEGTNAAVLPITMTFCEDDLASLNIDVSAVSEGAFLKSVHPVKLTGAKAFDLVELAGDRANDIFNVSYVPSSKTYTIEFSMLLLDSDSCDVKIITEDDHGYVVVWDGSANGKLTDPLTAYKPKEETPSPEPEPTPDPTPDPTPGPAPDPTPEPTPDSTPENGSSGGCTISGAPMAIMLLLPLMAILKR